MKIHQPVRHWRRLDRCYLKTNVSMRQFNVENLIAGCDQLGLVVNLNQRNSLLTHIKLLAKWNASLNLTAIKADNDMISHHILDSLAIYRYVTGSRLLDIGSGGGFPGLPLSIVNPNLAVTLLDSRGKRIEFLRHAVAVIGLDNVSLVKSRIEDYRPQEKFSTLSARAFSSLSTLIRLSKKNLGKGTRLLALKGKLPTQELATLSAELPESVRSRLTVKQLEVPFLQAQRHLIIIDF